MIVLTVFLSAVQFTASRNGFTTRREGKREDKNRNQKTGKMVMLLVFCVFTSLPLYLDDIKCVEDKGGDKWTCRPFYGRVPKVAEFSEVIFNSPLLEICGKQSVCVGVYPAHPDCDRGHDSLRHRVYEIQERRSSLRSSWEPTCCRQLPTFQLYHPWQMGTSVYYLQD